MSRKDLFISDICDLHSHILPDFDDGAKDINESIAMLKKAQREGIGIMAATPHLVLDGSQNKFLLRAEKAIEELRSNEINIKLLLGFELFLDENIFTLQSIEQFTINNSSLLLFEIDENCPEELLFDAVLWLLDKNITPVMAHPERCFKLSRIMKKLKLLSDKGLLFQINTSSITGSSGFFVMRRAKYLAQSGMKFVLGSDAHNLIARPPKMREALKKLEDWIGLDLTLSAAKITARSMLNI